MQRKLIYCNGITNKLDKLRWGNYALVAKSSGVITEEQLYATRIAIKRQIRHFGKLWVCLQPNKIKTSKSCGMRMGKGKSDANNKLIYFVKKDEVIIELGLGKYREFALKLLKLASSKLSVRTQVLTK